LQPILLTQMKVYLDNAATTPLDNEVLETMLPFLKEHFGNPSSTHDFGRKAKSGIEKARKDIAALLNASASEIVFTSGGTEADNMAIYCSIYDLGVKHIVTSDIEHHAVTHTVEHFEKCGLIKTSYLKVDEAGRIDLKELELLLANNPQKTLVSLMHANNEIGTVIDLKSVGEICKKYNAYFHSDTVQTMGHFNFDMKELNLHFATGAAHKFHGPKGVGFLYLNKEIKIKPLINGGSQERNLRGGTENLYGIVGLGKALELACKHLIEHKNYIENLREYLKNQLIENIPGISFNGCQENYLYTVLSASFPKTENASMLLFLLDIDGIAVSSGSACTSGSNTGSHVLRGIGSDPERTCVRFSFSKLNTKEELDYVVKKLKAHLALIHV
jgi:cysteine desulfurase